MVFPLHRVCFFVGIVCNFHMFVCFFNYFLFFFLGRGVILLPTRPCFSIKAKGVGLDTCFIAFGMKFAWGNESEVESTLKCVLNGLRSEVNVFFHY